MADDSGRPNIRIEIHNNLAEEVMEVDEETKVSENEDGEISDSNDVDDVTINQASNHKGPINIYGSKRVWPNAAGGFSTGINIFDKQEQEKLLERAKRFQLNPNEVKNFSDEQLQELHDSLGITVEDEKDIRFEAIHMRGTDDMSTEDVLEYFGKYCPIAIEWINDESCNVVWTDKISTARALFYLSSPIKGMPVEGPCDPFMKELEVKEGEENEDPTKGRSILLKNTNREIEVRDDEVMEDKENTEGTIHVSQITVPIPPGYWRLGVPHHKAKFILVRFSFKTDKKPYRAEKFSKYYKKYGNPNFDGIKGLISESHRLKSRGIFDRNRDITNKSNLAVGDKNKNPWGALAENWYEDAQFTERIVVPHKPPTLNKTIEESSIMNRLGFKRAHIETQESKEEPPPEKKSKIPRMRMYADEEEEKIKRRKKLMAVKVQANVKQEEDTGARPDLRSILKPVKSTRLREEPESEEENEEVSAERIDLGSRLKNRNRQFISEDHLVHQEHMHDSFEVTLRVSDKEQRHKEKSYKPRSDRRRRENSPPRKHRPSRYDTLHSDRYERERRRKETEQYYEEEFDSRKPRSKVAVVIKTQKKPTVASQVWSRLHSDREQGLKSIPVKSRVRRAYTSSSEESSSESSSTSSSSSTTSEGSSSESDVEDEAKPSSSSKFERPGFGMDYMSKRNLNHKSPLRIEINNDFFKKE